MKRMNIFGKRILVILLLSCILFGTTSSLADYEGSLEFLTALLKDYEPVAVSPHEQGFPCIIYSLEKTDFGYLFMIIGTSKAGDKRSVAYAIPSESDAVIYAASMARLWQHIANEYGFPNFTMMDDTYVNMSTGRITIDSKGKADAYLLDLKKRYSKYAEEIDTLINLSE